MKNFIAISIFLFLANQVNAQFYATPHGSKYHRGDCKLVERNSFIECSEYEATSNGYEPCKICIPDKNGPGGGDPKRDDNQGLCPTVQCSGTTLKGERCKHKTTICGGRCYEHGGG